MSINVIVGVLFLATLALAAGLGYMQRVIMGLQDQIDDAQTAIDAHLFVDHGKITESK